MNNRKKKILLMALLALLGGILTWQWLHREQPVPAVKDDTEHRALAVFQEMLEVGRLKGWSATARFWHKTPDRTQAKVCETLFGRSFRNEFIFQGSAVVSDSPDQLILYGTFSTGNQAEIVLQHQENSFKILSIQEM